MFDFGGWCKDGEEVDDLLEVKEGMDLSSFDVGPSGANDNSQRLKHLRKMLNQTELID